MKLTDAFGSFDSLSVVGAGGKKTTLYALAGECTDAVVTSTVRIPPFSSHVADVVVSDDPVAAVRDTDERPLGVVAGTDGDRHIGYDPDAVDELIGATDATVLIKADGARTRRLKAPGDHEPQLPRTTDLVVPIASAKVVGKPLSGEIVHRPERVAAITDLGIGDEITADDVAAVLTSRSGGLKQLPESARAVPLVNMVDTKRDERAGREIAERILAREPVDRVVLARMDRRRIVDVIS